MANKERKITFRIGAKNATNKVFKSITRGLTKMKKLGIAAGKTFAKGFGVGVVAVGALVGSLGALIVKVAQTQDIIGKTADKLGIGTEALTGLKLAGEQAGVEFGTMNKSIQKMEENLSDAVSGIGTAKDSINDLGLDAGELSKLEPDKALLKIVEALDKVKNAGDKVRIASDIFGARGAGLINLTAAGIKSARIEVEAFGTALDRKTVKGMETFNDNIGRVWESFKGFATQLSAQVVPVLNVLLEKVVSFAKEGGLAEWGRRTGKAIADLIPQIIQVVKVASVAFVQAIPDAMIFMLGFIGKVGLAFSGWELIFNGLKQGWLALQIVMQEGLKKLAQGMLVFLELQNIGGVFDGQIATTKAAIAEQSKIIATLDTGLNDAIDEQQKILDNTDKQQSKMEEYKKSVEGMSGAFKDFADSMSSEMDKAADESIASINRVEERASKMKFTNVGPVPGGADSIEGFSRTLDENERRGGGGQ